MMAVFKELMKTKKLSDPEERKAEDIKRSEEPTKKKVKNTSVSADQYIWTIRIITVFTVLIFLCLLALGIYYGISIFVM